MSDIPEEVRTAAAVAIHDVDCPDTRCGDAALGHAYRLADAALAAAWPHFVAAAEERTAGMAEALKRAEAIIGERDEQLAHERERAEALIVQAQDYASAESERAGNAVTLAQAMLQQLFELHPAGAAPYLTEWSMALEQLDGAAGEMSPPDSDPLEEANQAGIKWERERIARLAVDHAATASKCAAGTVPQPSRPCACRSANPAFPFADLIPEEPS